MTNVRWTERGLIVDIDHWLQRRAMLEEAGDEAGVARVNLRLASLGYVEPVEEQ